MAKKSGFKPPVKGTDMHKELSSVNLELRKEDAMKIHCKKLDKLLYEKKSSSNLSTNNEENSVSKSETSSPASKIDMPPPKQQKFNKKLLKPVAAKEDKRNSHLESESMVKTKVSVKQNSLKSVVAKNTQKKTFKESLKVIEESQQSSEPSTMETEIFVLSQPPASKSHRERLEWLRDRRGNSIYINCDNCGKWRSAKHITDPVDVPEKWTCALLPKKNDCKYPEKQLPLSIEEDLIHNKYTAGSLVWAKVEGFPWWPGIVDDCPDAMQYYWLGKKACDIPTDYNVVFFDSRTISRAWVEDKNIISFKHHPDYDVQTGPTSSAYKQRIGAAKKQAEEASKLDIKERLKRFGFLALWPLEIKTPPTSSDDDSSDEKENSPDKVTQKKKTQIVRTRSIRSLSTATSRTSVSADDSQEESSSSTDYTTTSSEDVSELKKPSKETLKDNIGFDKTITVDRILPMKINQRIKEDSATNIKENAARTFAVKHKREKLQNIGTECNINSKITTDQTDKNKHFNTDSDTSDSSIYISPESTDTFSKLLRDDIIKKRLSRTKPISKVLQPLCNETNTDMVKSKSANPELGLEASKRKKHTVENTSNKTKPVPKNKKSRVLQKTVQRKKKLQKFVVRSEEEDESIKDIAKSVSNKFEESDSDSDSDSDIEMSPPFELI